MRPADPHAAGRPRAGADRRDPLQRPGLPAQLFPHAGAPPARLCALSRLQRRDGEGGQALRPQRLPGRAVQRGSPTPCTGTTAAWRCAAPPGAASSPRSARSPITSPMRVDRLAHGAGAVQPRRPRPSWPARSCACAACSKACCSASRRSPGRRSISTTCSPSSTSGRAILSPAHALPFPQPDPARASSSRMSASAIPDTERWAVRGLNLDAAGRRGAGAGRRERRGQDHHRQAPGPALRPDGRPHPARGPGSARLRPRRSCAASRRDLPGLRALPLHRRARNRHGAHRRAREDRGRDRATRPSAASPTRSSPDCRRATTSRSASASATASTCPAASGRRSRSPAPICATPTS